MLKEEPEMLEISVTSMAKELYSCLYQLRTCVIIHSVLDVRFHLFYSHHYFFLMFMFLFIPCKILIYSTYVFSISINTALFSSVCFFSCLSVGNYCFFYGSYICLEQLTWEEVCVYVFPWKRMRRFCEILNGNFLFNFVLTLTKTGNLFPTQICYNEQIAPGV